MTCPKLLAHGDGARQSPGKTSPGSSAVGKSIRIEAKLLTFETDEASFPLFLEFIIMVGHWWPLVTL